MSSLQKCLVLLVSVLVCGAAGAVSYNYTAYATPNTNNWLVTANWSGVWLERPSDNQPFFAFFMAMRFWPLSEIFGQEISHLCKQSAAIQSMPPARVVVSGSLSVRMAPLAVLGDQGSVTIAVGDEDTFRRMKYGPVNYKTDTRNVVLHRDYRYSEPNLEITFFYMTRQNFEEMRKGITTEVIIPYMERHWYFKLYFNVYYIAYSVHTQSCNIYRPNTGKTFLNTQIKPGSYFYGYRKLADDGTYTFECIGQHYYSADNSYVNVTTTKSLVVTTIDGPMIRLHGEDKNCTTKLFPSWNESGSLLVDVYTMSSLTNFEVEKIKGVPHNKKILVKQVSYNPFEIIAVYRIEIPWLTDSVSGTFALTVENKDRENTTLNVEIIKAKALQVAVSPIEHTVAEGVNVTFECFVDGNVIDSVHWRRDFEELDKNKYSVVFGEFSDGEKRGLRLTFQQPRLADSGIYVCQASNRFETKKSTIKLAVYPPGSHYIEPSFQATDEVANASNRVEGSHVLNVTENELEEEWVGGEIRILDRGRGSKEGDGVWAKVPWTLVVAGGLAAVVGVVILGCLIYVCRALVKCLRKRKASKKTATTLQKHKARSKQSASEDEEGEEDEMRALLFQDHQTEAAAAAAVYSGPSTSERRATPTHATGRSTPVRHRETTPTMRLHPVGVATPPQHLTRPMQTTPTRRVMQTTPTRQLARPMQTTPTRQAMQTTPTRQLARPMQTTPTRQVMQTTPTRQAMQTTPTRQMARPMQTTPPSNRTPQRSMEPLPLAPQQRRERRGR